MKPQKADLHLHTTASDGAVNPIDLVELVHSKGLSTIAITDHDSIVGYKMALPRARELGIELIPGVEITCNFQGRESHILAYGFDVTATPLLELLVSQRSKRFHRANGILDKLNGLGYDIDFDEVIAEAGKATISRNHIASVLHRKNYVSSKREAFDRLLAGNGPAYVQNGYPEVPDVIELINKCGGVCVLAHPGPYYNFEDLRFFLNNGITGMEYIHPSHNYVTSKKIKDYAENYKLLLSGGSDFHGTRPHEEQYLGVVCVDKIRAERILERCGIPTQSAVS